LSLTCSNSPEQATAPIDGAINLDGISHGGISSTPTPLLSNQTAVVGERHFAQKGTSLFGRGRLIVLPVFNSDVPLLFFFFE
jgi:hypothetical protein